MTNPILSGAEPVRPKPVTASVERRLVFFYVAVVLAFDIAQLSMGSSFDLTIEMAMVAVLGAIPIAIGFRRASDVLFFGCIAYLGTLALILKTLLGQSLDSNLFAPHKTGLFTILAAIAATGAYLLARLGVNERRSPAISAVFNSPSVLRLVARLCFAVGLPLQLVHLAIRPQFVNGSSELTEGFGGFGSFYFLVIAAFAAQIGVCFQHKRPPPREVAMAVTMMIAVGLLSVAANVKKDMLDALSVLLLMMMAFRIKPNWRWVVGGALAAGFVVFILTPIVHITRGEGLAKGQNSGATMDVSERFEYAAEIVEANHFDLAAINRLNDVVAKNYVTIYRPWGSYFYPSTANIDRFALVLPIDQVVRVNAAPLVPLSEVANRTAQMVLPSVLIKKSPGMLPDLVGWAYGFRTFGTVGRPVVGLAASSLAVGGLAALLAFPFLTLTPLFWLFDFVGGELKRNPWAVAMLASFLYIPEKEIDALLGILFRDLPIYVSTMWILILILNGGRTVAAVHQR